MRIAQLVTPLAAVVWLSVADTVHHAFVRMETRQVSAAPLVDRAGRYTGTLTEADLRRHVAALPDRALAFAMPLSAVARRIPAPAVSIDRELDATVEESAVHGFVPVVDDRGKLVGVVDRRRLSGSAV